MEGAGHDRGDVRELREASASQGRVRGQEGQVPGLPDIADGARVLHA